MEALEKMIENINITDAKIFDPVNETYVSPTESKSITSNYCVECVTCESCDCQCNCHVCYSSNN
jgi:hypothetical protein